MATDPCPCMDRRELRFRILFEYYERCHSPDNYNPEDKINKIDMPEYEKKAAKTWLIDSNFVEGKVNSHGMGRTLPAIMRINNYGIDFVESVMDTALTRVEKNHKSNGALSKTDKIKKFSTECLNNPTTGTLCKATFDAIITIMTQHP